MVPVWITAFGWVDGNPVHMLTTADGGDMGSVTRSVGGGKISIAAPAAVAQYNKYMQGVDHNDQLCSKFSLAS